jgi:hypothetical protein
MKTKVSSLERPMKDPYGAISVPEHLPGSNKGRRQDALLRIAHEPYATKMVSAKMAFAITFGQPLASARSGPTISARHSRAHIFQPQRLAAKMASNKRGGGGSVL